jgi:exodeoxyribonuclease V alpha subunit
MSELNEKQWIDLRKRITRSKLRSQFKMTDEESAYAKSRGKEILTKHAYDFLIKRLAPAQPQNEGRQTPMKGHPVFIAQHATGTCCRECLEKWHKIKRGAKLKNGEIDYVVSVVMKWITEKACLQ